MSAARPEDRRLPVHHPRAQPRRGQRRGRATFTVADVPGLIPGAAPGPGLGLDFLRHVERCSVLLHVLDCATLEPGPRPAQRPRCDRGRAGRSTTGDVRRAARPPRLVALNKVDVPEAAELAELVRADLEARGLRVFAISAVTHAGLRELTFALAADGRGGPGRPARLRAGRDRAAARGGRRRRLHRRPRPERAGRLHRARRASPSGGCARPTSTTTRPSATWPTGWPGSASRTSWLELGAEPGAVGDHRRRHLRLRADCGRPTSRLPRRPARHRRSARRVRRAPRPTTAWRARSRAGVHEKYEAGRGRSSRRRDAAASAVAVSATVRGAGSRIGPRSHRRQVARRRRLAASTNASTRLSMPSPSAAPPASQVVLVSSGAIAAGIGPLGLRTRPRDLATQQAAASVGQLLLVERYAASFARYGLHGRPGAAHRRRPAPRGHYRNAAPHPGAAARPSASSRSSTRTTPSRRTRSASATTTGSPRCRPPGARRRAGPAVRRRRPLHRQARTARIRRSSPRSRRMADLDDVDVGRARQRRRHRRHGDQDRRGRDRDRRGHPGAARRGRLDRRRRWRRDGGTCFHAAATAGVAAVLAAARDARRGAGWCSTTARSPPSCSGASPCCRPAITSVAGELRCR